MNVLKQLYLTSDYHDKSGMIFNTDCMELMSSIKQGGVFDVTLTDIPYSEVNRKDNGLRNLDKSNADILTFDIKTFLEETYRLTKGTIIIFCGNEQYSTIYSFFNEKSKQNLGTTRQIIWHKTNPSPMNGQHIYLSATENAVWFKKRGATFNAHIMYSTLQQDVVKYIQPKRTTNYLKI